MCVCVVCAHAQKQAKISVSPKEEWSYCSCCVYRTANVWMIHLHFHHTHMLVFRPKECEQNGPVSWSAPPVLTRIIAHFGVLDRFDNMDWFPKWNFLRPCDHGTYTVHGTRGVSNKRVDMLRPFLWVPNSRVCRLMTGESYNLLIWWLWVSYLTSLSITFLIYEITIRTVLCYCLRLS